jgi:beta-N-acetylhexosaminidase
MDKPQHIGSIIIDIEGYALSAADQRLLANRHIGGVILFSRNYQSPEQVTALIQQIKHVNSDLLVTVDQEGGRIQRFRQGLTSLPSLRTIGESYAKRSEYTLQFAYDCGWLMAAEMLSLGVDVSFAPVLDIDYGVSEVIGNRSFHRDPAVIIALAQRYIAGMRQAGMVAIGKHFPGHGGVAADTHTDKAIDCRDAAILNAEDLQPFAQLIQQQCLHGIMPSHVIYQAVAPEPAGFSPYWLQDVLKQQLGFQGMIFSDDLSMRAAGMLEDMYERVLVARAAGCDFVLICNNHEQIAGLLQRMNETGQPLTQKPRNFYGQHPYTWQQLQQNPLWKKIRQTNEWYNH